MRWRRDLPWFPSEFSPWVELAVPDRSRIAVLPSEDGLAYEVFVNGAERFRFATFETRTNGRVADVPVRVVASPPLPAGLSLRDVSLRRCVPGS